MRTTITLDPDVDSAVRRLMRERGLTFDEAVNTAIRWGLGGMTGLESSEPFTFPTYRMGHAKIGLDEALQVAAELEDEELRRKRA